MAAFDQTWPCLTPLAPAKHLKNNTTKRSPTQVLSPQLLLNFKHRLDKNWKIAHFKGMVNILIKYDWYYICWSFSIYAQISCFLYRTLTFFYQYWFIWYIVFPFRSPRISNIDTYIRWDAEEDQYHIQKR